MKQNQLSQPFRFAVMLDGLYLEAWMAEAIRQLMVDGHLFVLCISRPETAVKQSLSKKLRNYQWHNLLFNLYHRFLFKPEAKQVISFDAITFNGAIISVEPKQHGPFNTFTSEQLKEIGSFSVDFILRFGYDILKGEILTLAKYGVWSFHHDDETKYRGLPPGFWEIYRNDAITGSILQQLTEKLDGGLILQKGYFPTIKHSWNQQINQTYFASASWPSKICRMLQTGNPANFETPANKGKLYKAPNNLQMIWFITKLTMNRLSFYYEKYLTAEDWSIGINQSNNPAKLERESQWIFPKKHAAVFMADPFYTKYGIWYEHFDYRTGKGTINQYDTENGYTECILEEPFHLSYPCPFEYENEHYCIPETSAMKEIRLYKYNLEKRKLVFVKTLLKNIEAADPTIFFYNGLWWMFFTKVPLANEELHIWFSQNPINSAWQMHPHNPVKISVVDARPAGLPFVLEGKLIRPAQNSEHGYGSKTILMEIVKLTPETFEEKYYGECLPVQPWNKGIHTVNITERGILHDGKQLRFNQYSLWWNLKKRINNV